MKKSPLNTIILLICISIFISCNKTNRVVDYLMKDINTPGSRAWGEFIKNYGIDAIDEDGMTILLQAIAEENIPLIELCIQAKANPNLTSEGKLMPLQFAVRKDNWDIVEILLKAEARVRGEIPSRYDILYQAIEKSAQENNIGFAESVIKYYTKSDMDYRGYRSILSSGVFWNITEEKNAIEYLELLDNHGFKPHYRDVSTISERYIFFNDEPSIKDMFYLYLEKYYSDPWYLENKKNFLSSFLTAYNIIKNARVNYDSLFKLIDLLILENYPLEPHDVAQFIYAILNQYERTIFYISSGILDEYDENANKAFIQDNILFLEGLKKSIDFIQKHHIDCGFNNKNSYNKGEEEAFNPYIQDECYFLDYVLIKYYENIKLQENHHKKYTEEKNKKEPTYSSLEWILDLMKEDELKADLYKKVIDLFLEKNINTVSSKLNVKWDIHNDVTYNRTNEEIDISVITDRLNISDKVIFK